MPEQRIVIIGAGLAGLSAAFHLKEKRQEALVFEKEPEVGGLCRSKRVNGFIFDLNGHLIHFKNDYTRTLLGRLMDRKLISHRRRSQVFTHNRLIPYPFQGNIFGLPLSVKVQCLSGLIKAGLKGRKKEGAAFSDWIIDNFGEGIARHFMFPYNRKFWTVPLNRLNSDWADMAIPKVGLREAMESFYGRGRREIGYNATFWYPREGGIEELPRSFARRLDRVYTSCRAEKIDLKNREVVFEGGLTRQYDKLILSMPIVEILDMIQGLPEDVKAAAARLKYVSIFGLNIGVDRDIKNEAHWVYFPERKFVFFRAGFYHNFSAHNAAAGKSALYAEVAYSQREPLDKKKLIDAIIADLNKAGIIYRHDRISAIDVNDIKYGYAIYDVDRNTALNVIFDFLRKHRIYPIGRYGRWAYMSMEDAILDGRQVAEELAAG
ncbi:MAG: FAD-dependent oxidoreductase [Candidatus Omnitrophica bacterium]|nr:FAD-dependent oxidoreductase [Candidatus Omnitrophota bacterium]